MIHKNLRQPLLSEPERKQWYEQMGPKEFMHIHHWCWALMHARRGNQSIDAGVRTAHYRTAITNFDYVIRNCSNSFVLKPEFHLRKGMTLRMLDDDAGAAAEFLQAIRLKPDYTPAYSALVDLQLDIGNLDEAMKLLDAGLARAPSSKILASKKSELQTLMASRQNQP